MNFHKTFLENKLQIRSWSKQANMNVDYTYNLIYTFLIDLIWLNQVKLSEKLSWFHEKF